MEEWKNGRMEGWKDGRMEGWKDGIKNRMPNIKTKNKTTRKGMDNKSAAALRAKC